MVRLTLICCCGATGPGRAASFPEDEPLEERALRAARSLAGRWQPALTLSSPALRARQTAEAMGLAARIEPSLRDCDFGRWAGLGLDAVIAGEPEAFAAFVADPTARPHGGESGADVAARVGSWLEALPASKGRIAAVTHPAVIRAALVHVLGAPLGAGRHIDVPPLSATELTSDGRRWAWRAGRALSP